MSPQNFDIVIVGGGPAGYVAALRAAQLGLRTAVVERERLGGICLNWGCIPTKSLLHTADVARLIRGSAELGLAVGDVAIDFARMMARSREAAERLSRGVANLLKKAGVTVFEGAASFTPERDVEVGLSGGGGVARLRAAHVILATGAHPRSLPKLPFDEHLVCSYRGMLSATTLPASLLVVGAGAIGVEFASLHASLGTRVTLVEARERLLPEADAEISAELRRTFEAEGIAVHTSTRVSQVRCERGAVRACLESEGHEREITAERMLVAIGLAANVDGLNLQHTGVRVERGHVVTDDWGATDEPGIHAVGDLTGGLMLAHRASHQAVLCVERIAGLHRDAAPPHAPIPICIYAHPQIAGVGLTEIEALRLGIPIRVGRFALQANGKAVAIGQTKGLVKTIFAAGSGELLGAHVVGHDATELIHGFALAKTLEATEAELIGTVFPHPTFSEALHESVLHAFGRALHV